MSNELHKKDIIDKISEKLIDEKITIGGNGKKYKRKYHLKYTQKIIATVLGAYWEVLSESIEQESTDGNIMNVWCNVFAADKSQLDHT